MNFLYPSKPEIIYDPERFVESLRRAGVLQNYRVQIKKNGCRALPVIESKVVIKDRYNTVLTVSLEKDWSMLKNIFPENTLLDGELIGRKQGETSNRLYLWDMPIVNNQDLTKVSYEERFSELKELFFNHVPLLHANHQNELTSVFIGDIEVGIAVDHPADQWKELLESVNYKGSTGENEGLVWKDITHSLNWDRFKTRNIPQQVKFLLKYLKKTI